MSIQKKVIYWVMVSFSISGCNLALDFDALQHSGMDTDTGPVPDDYCVVDGDCNDGFNCTDEVCGPDNRCIYTPDNSLCDTYEMCRRGEGCVPSGRECLVNDECDDGVDCTTDRCANGVCSSLPDDEWCGEFDPCWINSVCDPEVGCTGGYEQPCNQPAGASCYLVVCNPETGACDAEELKAGADSDNDGYCDDNPLFGGDDCNDGDPTVNPSKDDFCNVVDDNCDGVPDGTSIDGPAIITSGDNLLSPSLAFDGDRFAVVWQEGVNDTATVYFQMLGTGACLIDTACDTQDGSLPASSPIELTPFGGMDASGSSPAVAGFNGRFAVVWVSETEGDPPSVVMMALEPDGSEVVIDGSVTIISDGVAESIADPKIDWKGSEGWIAAWRADFADNTSAIQAVTQGGMPFTGLSSDVPIRGLSLSCFDGTDCLVAYTQEEIGDVEVFEARLQVSGTTLEYREGWPRLVSNASEADGDPSRDPAVAWIGSDAWVTSFTDIAVADINVGPEPETDIRAADDGIVRAVVAEELANQQNAGLAFDGNRFGVLYVNDREGAITLDFRLMDVDFNLYDRQLTRLAEVTSGGFVVAPLVFTGDGFAIAWVAKPALSTNTFHIAHFSGCVPSTK